MNGQPHEALLAVAASMGLTGLDGGQDKEHALARFSNWLDAADPADPLRRIREGFVLDGPSTALLGLLFAAALSEALARGLAEAAGPGRGVPVWLVRRIIPGLPEESLAAAGRLRRFELIGVENGVDRIEARLWLSEPVLDRLSGFPVHEPELAARFAPCSVRLALASEALAKRLKAALSERREGLSPVVLAGSSDPAVLAATLAALGLKPWLLRPSELPDEARGRDHLARIWSREAALDGAVLILPAEQGVQSLIAAFADRVAGHVVVSGPMAAGMFQRPVHILGEAPPTTAGAVERWRGALGARATRVGGELARVASHFRLGPAEIDAVCSQVGGALDAACDERAAARILWHAAGRATLPAPIPGVAIAEPVYQWSDIVLAPHLEQVLRRIETHVRHAAKVMDEWGFSERMGGRGRGVAALFAGPSGTGKTMAAEVLASSLDLQMMLIDLSQIISKYIGETSKNIAAAFDQAERCGAVMVWNEGDAIWGARGAVGNAADRHINAEVGDLLQRIEAFGGFTIITTNLRHAIDPAFMRRFRFVVDFPMPSEEERLRIWSQAFPRNAPVEPVDWGRLAALPLSGGSIRNVALGSAFLAAEAGGSIDRGLIAAELSEELRKHDQPMPILDWEERA
jgi:hypothetical protein